MTLSDILALWAGKNLPQDAEQLAACRKVMQSAFDITMEAWRLNSNPVTTKMLGKELETYDKILNAINRRQIAQILKARRAPKYAPMRRLNSMSHLPSSAL